MEPDTWIRDCGEHYEQIAVCVDDLLTLSKDPQNVVGTLMSKHYFKLKGTGHVSYHLECDFGRDKDGTLHFTPRKHIEEMK